MNAQFAEEMAKIANARLNVKALAQLAKRTIPGAAIGGTAGFLYGKGDRKKDYAEEAIAGAVAGAGIGGAATGIIGGVSAARKAIVEAQKLTKSTSGTKTLGKVKDVVDDPGGFMARQKQVLDTEAKFNAALDDLAKKSGMGFGENVNQVLRRIVRAEDRQATPARMLRRPLTVLEQELRDLNQQLPIYGTWKKKKGRQRRFTTPGGQSVEVTVRPQRRGRVRNTELHGFVGADPNVMGPRLNAEGVRARMKTLKADIRSAIKDLRAEVAQINKEIRRGEISFDGRDYTSPLVPAPAYKLVGKGKKKVRTYPEVIGTEPARSRRTARGLQEMRTEASMLATPKLFRRRRKKK